MAHRILPHPEEPTKWVSRRTQTACPTHRRGDDVPCRRLFAGGHPEHPGERRSRSRRGDDDDDHGLRRGDAVHGVLLFAFFAAEFFSTMGTTLAVAGKGRDVSLGMYVLALPLTY